MAQGWRLPNFKELLTLVDYSQTGPALVNGNPFVDALATLYWSSTTYEPAARTVFGVEKTGQTNCYDDSGTLIPCVGGEERDAILDRVFELNSGVD